MKKTILTIIFAFIFVNIKAQAPDWAWAKGSSGAIGMNYVTCTATDELGNVYVAGEYTSPTITFGTFTLTNWDAGWRDIFIVKYDPAGNVIWAKNEGGTDGDYISSIDVDAFNNIYITGKYTSSSISFGTITLSNPDFFIDPIFIVKYDDLGNVIWANDIECRWTDESHMITNDLQGNAYVIGQFYSDSISIGSNIIYNNSITNSYPDVFIVKYDTTGNIVWAKSEGGLTQDYGYGVTTDTLNNVYITGYFFSTSINFGGTTLVNADSTGNSPDVFIVKYNDTGDLLWAKREGAIGYDIGWNIKADGANNIYVAGEFSSPVNFGSTTLINADFRDLFIAKYDSLGNVLWAAGAGGIGYDQSNSVSFDASNNVYLGGIFASDSISFGASTLYNQGTNFDVFVAKFSPVGNIIWAKGAGSPGIDLGVSAVDSSGNIYVAGSFRYTNFINFGATTLLNNDTSGTFESMFVAKLSDIYVGFKEPKNWSESNIYPNPSYGIFTISSTHSKLLNCSIYNVIGERVFSQQSNPTNQLNIDLSAQAKGIYFVETTDENWNVSNTKIIIQ